MRNRLYFSGEEKKAHSGHEDPGQLGISSLEVSMANLHEKGI